MRCCVTGCMQYQSFLYSLNRIGRAVKYQSQFIAMTIKAQNLRAKVVLIQKIRLLQLMSEKDRTPAQMTFNTTFTLYQIRGKKFKRRTNKHETHYCSCYWEITLLFYYGLAGVVTSTCHCFQFPVSDETWCKITSHLLN